jgi:hypothetical protein
MFRSVFLSIMLLCVAAPALAQDEGDEEIVVTGTILRRFEDFSMPHVSRVRRADFAVRNLTITSDTRDATQRRQELEQALRSLTRYADRSARMSVALIAADDDESGESRVIGFTVEKALESLRPSGRPDTSQVTVAVRSAISASDDIDAVDERFNAFVRAIPRPGRVETQLGGMELTLNNPQQYRAGLIADIARDATQISSAIGAGYGARLEGLENPIAWRRAGDLDLRLFVPYRMVILPREAS